MSIYTLRTGASSHPEDTVLQLVTDLIATSGVLDISGDQLQVEEQASPDMTVLVNDGRAYIKGSSGNAYPVRVDADTNVSISANSSGNDRIDALVLYIDKSASADTTASNVAKLYVVEGTPAASPSAPTDNDIQTEIGASNPFIRLADITVSNGATSITNSDITDQRTGVEFDDVVKTNYLSLAEGQMFNGKIEAAVASNNLTVSIKTLAGNDPSASDPVYVRINNTIRSITTALSVTKNAGTNWFGSGGAMFAAKERDYFVYLGYNATDGVTIGFAVIPYGREYADFSATTTNEKYCAISTITNAAAGDDYENIGRFAATLSAGAGYTWSVPTFTNKNLIQSSIFETRWLEWLPTYGAGGSMTFSCTVVGRYKMIGNLVHWYVNASGTTGGTASTYITFTVPFVMTNCPPYHGVAFGTTYDAGDYVAYCIEDAGSLTTIRVYKDGLANWGLGSSRAGRVRGFFEN